MLPHCTCPAVPGIIRHQPILLLDNRGGGTAWKTSCGMPPKRAGRVGNRRFIALSQGERRGATAGLTVGGPRACGLRRNGGSIQAIYGWFDCPLHVPTIVRPPRRKGCSWLTKPRTAGVRKGASAGAAYPTSQLPFFQGGRLARHRSAGIPGPLSEVQSSDVRSDRCRNRPICCGSTPGHSHILYSKAIGPKSIRLYTIQTGTRVPSCGGTTSRRLRKVGISRSGIARHAHHLWRPAAGSGRQTSGDSACL